MRRNMLAQRSLKRFRKDVKGISPLVTTLLLIVTAVAASAITYSWVMSMIGSQSERAQTQVRIDSIKWDVANNAVNVTVINTGSVDATIETVAVRLSTQVATWYPVSVSATITTGGTVEIEWDGTGAGLTLAASNSYVIRVTTSTDFYYEMNAVSPA
jgi:FlaG/FlaF family flagellin (archaellin)